MIEDLTDWVTDVVHALGYVGVAFLVALESVLPPIPSELILPLAGFVAGQGEASLLGMIVAATVGSVVGALVLYAISAAVGADRLRAFVVQYGRWIGVKEADLDRADSWFDRRSDVAVLVCRCIPLVRSLVSIPAGFRRMPLPRFILFTALGSLVWNAALVGAGALLGDNWEQVGDVIGRVQEVVILVIALAIGFFVWRRIVKPRLRRPIDPSTPRTDRTED
ncbi:DedA family protein [soil metagenome]